MDDREVRERVAHLERLLERVDDYPEALAVVEELVAVYGEALRRLLVDAAEPTQDELLSHLLLVHDLHPESVETRVRRALDEVRPYLGSHGGGVELLEVAGGRARVRLEGTCNGCASSTVTLRNAIEEAVLRAAPELEGVEAEGAEPAAAQQLLQIRPLECPTELQSA